MIFGASGDLTRRKLIPALYDLTCVGCVPRKFEVLGVGRTPMTTEEFRARMREGALDSDRELFWIIKNGIRLSGMPAFGKVETDTHIWNLVDYLRTIPQHSQGKEQARSGM